MIWLNAAGVSPAGADTHMAYMGWDVWTGTVSDWKYVAYGFELYDYPGTGFAVTSFTSDVN